MRRELGRWGLVSKPLVKITVKLPSGLLLEMLGNGR